MNEAKAKGSHKDELFINKLIGLTEQNRITWAKEKSTTSEITYRTINFTDDFVMRLVYGTTPSSPVYKILTITNWLKELLYSTNHDFLHRLEASIRRQIEGRKKKHLAEIFEKICGDINDN